MIFIMTKSYCPYCDMAKNFLKSIEKDFEEIDVTNNEEKMLEISQISRMRTVPQIFDGEISFENLIGGYDDMMKKFENNEIFLDIKK